MIAAGVLSGAPACAGEISAAVEAGTGEVRRGLDWSGGRGVIGAEVYGSIAGLDASVRVVTLRGSARHGGADAVADLRLAREWPVGPAFVWVEAVGHVFVNAQGRMDYAEAGAGVRYALGPVEIDGRAYYAPPQAAIGGSNVHVRASATAGLPGTPLTLAAALGRSAGSKSGGSRLRPGGSYTDWKLGVEYSRGPLSAGIDYTGTSGGSGLIARGDLDDRVVARAALRF